MIQLPDASYDSLQHLLESSKHLHTELVRSPLWELVKNEPVIRQWMAALSEVESILKPKEELDGKPVKT